MQAKRKRSSMVDAILAELDQEADATRRLLALVPDDKLSWRPHPKAMSLGQLALHVASTQGGVAEGTVSDFIERPTFDHPEAHSCDQIVAAFDDGLNRAKAIVSATSDERAQEEWRIIDGDSVVLAMPRIAFWRTVMLNHVYHHRGQLATYLRILDIPLPSVYGPSADTDAFG